MMPHTEAQHTNQQSIHSTAWSLYEWLLGVGKNDRLRASPLHERLRGAASGLRGARMEHTDGAGRRHRLYCWGEVPVLARRLAHRGGELVRRAEPALPPDDRPGTIVFERAGVRSREDDDPSEIPF
jgi:hypothetical protein